MSTRKVKMCMARVSDPPHYLHPRGCSKAATHTFDDLDLCGTHLRIAKRWKQEGRLSNMVEFWWNVKASA